MYKILVDGNVLYHPLLSNEGHDITSGNVSVELDKTGSATITIPSDNLSYSNISKLKSMIEVYKDNDQIFRGRVLHDDRDFDNNKELYCEGELSFMMDNVFPPYSFTNQSVADVFATFVSVYNTQVEPAKQFVVGDVTVTGTVTYTSYDFAVLLDELNTRLVDQFGGHIRTRYDATNDIHYIDYLADYTDICNQAIEFGVNLLDFEEYISAEDLFTVLIPLGAEQKDAEGNYIGRVNITGIQTGGHEYVEDVDARAIFGNVWKINVWDDVTDPYELKALGEAYLSENVTAATTITLKAVDLSLIDIDADAIHLGDGIRVISRPHGLDAVFQCSRINYDLLDPANSEYEFGAPQKSISQQQVDNANASRSGIENSDARSDEALIEAKQYTDLEILKVTNSYESDTSVATSISSMSSAYADLVDRIGPKQYWTSNGESRMKLGVLAEDLVARMNAEGISNQPIVTSIGAGHYSVSYDEIVALLWKKVQTIQNEMANFAGYSLWSVLEHYSKALDSTVISGSCRYVQGVCYNTSTNRVVFSLIDGSTEGILVESSLDLQTIYRKTSPLPIGHGNSLAYVPSTNTILVVPGQDGTYANKIIAVDASTLEISTTYSTPNNATPVQIAYDSVNDKVYCQVTDSKILIYSANMVLESIVNIESTYDYVPSSTGQGAFAHKGVYYLIRSDQTNERSYFCSYNLSTGAVKDILYIPTISSFEAEDGFSIGNDIYIIGGQAEVGLKKIGLTEVVRRFTNG